MVGERWKIGHILKKEIEVKIGHKWKKNKKNVQKTGYPEKEDKK